MLRLPLVLLSGLMMAACTTSPWVWQDTRNPVRDDASADLAACRSYASAQYRPGIPAGDPYLAERDGIDPWLPDRDPLPPTGLSQQTLHGVPVPYTGYPGYQDYHPGFLDALVEKCMADRGWVFAPAEGTARQERRPD